MAAHREKNYEDLQLLADSFTRPEMNPKFLNSVYALRNAWASRGYLIERERKLLRAHATRFKKLEEFLPKEVEVEVVPETPIGTPIVYKQPKAKSSPVRSRTTAKPKAKVTPKQTKKDV